MHFRFFGPRRCCRSEDARLDAPTFPSKAISDRLIYVYSIGYLSFLGSCLGCILGNRGMDGTLRKISVEFNLLCYANI